MSVDILTVDFETYYDKAFSLSKLTTEEYVRDPRFEVIGVSVAVNEEQPTWFSGTKKQVKRFLDGYDWRNSAALAHNAMFDMAILNWHFDIRPKRILDTLSMARALDGPDAGNSLAKLAERHGAGVKGDEVIHAIGMRRLDFGQLQLAAYGAYCNNDVMLTYRLFQHMMERFPTSELRLIDLTIRMFTEPVLELDKSALTAHLTDVKEKKEKLLSKAITSKDNLMSNPQLAETLRSLGVEPPMKISATTGRDTYAFAKSDEAFKALLEHEDPVVQAIVSARLGVKSTLEETRTKRFIGIAERGRLPIPLRYYAAHTGRWGGDDKVNMQNLPRKSPLKKALKAPEGFVVIDCDSSQIEARTLAWLAGQEDLVEAFDRGEDVYKIMASAIYGKSTEDITNDERFVGKTTILGCLAEGTLVLTDRGWVAIENVTPCDRLWDGEEWVCHQGLVKKGTKETLNLCGLWLTPDHKVLCGTKWLEAQYLEADAATLSLALATGAVSWLYPVTSWVQEGVSHPSLSAAIAADRNTQSIGTTSRHSKALDALCAADAKGTESVIGSIYPSYPTQNTGYASLTACLPPSLAAIPPAQKNTPTMGRAVLPCTNSGATTEPSFFGTSKLCLGGMTQPSTWIGPITTRGTSQETYASCPERKTTQTEGRSASCRQTLMTYDIAYAGPRNRYTVATNAGPLIVHNCGYGMGWAKFQQQLKTFDVDMPADECKRIIEVYRSTYPMIPELWREAGMALDAMASGVTAPLGREGVLSVEGAEGIRLPNGLRLRYPNLRWQRITDKPEMVYDVKRGRTVLPTRIYGGKCVENVCQALARIAIGEQMLKIAKKLRVAMTVHDSVVALAPEPEAGKARFYVECCMRERPKWAADLPLNCESKMGASYGG